MSTIGNLFLESIQFRFQGIKELGDKALAQLDDDDLNRSPGVESNSIAVIVRHMHGNMLSRWTDFLTTDGDKPWRDRDGEFEPETRDTAETVRKNWEAGWNCVFDAIAALTPDDLLKEVVIRGQSLGVIDAIERQVAHYGYHTGQIVYLARMWRAGDWQTLSIPRGASKAYTPKKRD